MQRQVRNANTEQNSTGRNDILNVTEYNTDDSLVVAEDTYDVHAAHGQENCIDRMVRLFGWRHIPVRVWHFQHRTHLPPLLFRPFKLCHLQGVI